MVRLTQTVQKGGCAAKVGADALKRILSKVEFPKPHSELLIDGKTFDDAAIYKVSEKLALVQTLDFFTPVVDEPKVFGQIAAANAMSDVYAMGGVPKTCMAILAFPLSTMDENIVADVMQGAAQKIEEAGANLVGGHSIDDDTLKFGLSVTGYVDPKHIWSNAGARPGDILLLTKPLGTGTLCAGLKRDVWNEDDVADAMKSMAMLNAVPELLSEKILPAVHAATDITGFGLSGHSMQMARASGVSIDFIQASLPVFSKTYESLEKELLTKAHGTNRQYTSTGLVYRKRFDLSRELLMHDPQTSGGLLLAISPDKIDEVEKAIRHHFPRLSRVGMVGPRRDYLVSVE